MGTTRRQWVIAIVVAATLAFALAAYNRPEPPTQSRALQTYTSIEDLYQGAPFALKVSYDLPMNYSFVSGTVNPDPDGNGLNTKVDLTFAAWGKPNMYVTESRSAIVLGGQAVPVSFGSATGQMQKEIRADGSVVTSVVFKTRELYIRVSAVGIPETDLLAVAQAFSKEIIPGEPVPQ
ncbi:MAG: hypothetical protein ACYC5Y_07200 [Symbiobacteriia bacterium]